MLNAKVVRASCCWFFFLAGLLGFGGVPSASASITSTSGNVLYVDSSSNVTPNLLGNYVSYVVTNDTGSAIADAWVTAGSFSGSYVTLGVNEPGKVHVGPLANGASTTVFFYLNVNCSTFSAGQCNVTTQQAFSVNLYSGPPSTNLVASQQFSVTVQETTNAQANKVTAVTTTSTDPILGSIMTVTITGATGTIGGANVFYENPQTTYNFPANVFRLYSTSVTFSGGNTGTYSNLLLVPSSAFTSSSSTNYTFVATYLVGGMSSTSTPVSPVAFISSGTQIKHTDTSGFASLPPIPPTSNAITIQKLVSANTLPTGGVVTYTLRASNTASTAITLDSFVDTLPAGVTYLPGSSTFGGTPIGDPLASGNTLTWTNLFAVPANGIADLTFKATIPNSPGTYTNSAVAYIGTTQLDTTIATNDNSPATVSVSVGTPLLSVSSTHTGNFTTGQTSAVYTLTAGNTGSGPTNGTVMVADMLPTGLTATAISGSGWSCTLGAAPSCTRSDALASGSSYPAITLTVNVASNAAPTLTNSVTASGGGATSIATANDVTTITQLPVLSVSSTHTGNFTAGQTGAVYTLLAGNTGAGPTSSPVTVTDILPTGLTATAISASGWICTLGVAPSCSRSDPLAPGSSYPPITVTVNVSNNAAATVTNSVTASGGGATSNATANDVTAITQLPVLSVSSTHAGNFTAGQMGAVYTLTAGNTGTGPTNGAVIVTDTLPTGLTATAISGIGWSCTLGISPSCTRSDVLGSGSSYPAITVTVNVASSAAATLTNSVTASGGGATSNATASDVTTVTQLPVLSVSSTHTGNFTAGQTGAVYTLTVGNTGAGPTSSPVTITDTLPAGLTATAMSGAGWTCTLGTAPSCTRSDVLGSGSSYPAITLTVNVTSTAASTLTNSVTASGGGATNSATASDVTSVTQLPVLSVSSSHTGNFTAGQTGAVYTLTSGNTGTGPTTGIVMVTDTLPTGLTATAMSGSGWTCTPGVAPSCTRSDVLAAGSSYPAITLTVNVASTAAATVTNSVTASGGGATSNATAIDATSITQLPVLSVSSTHAGNFTAGQTGAVYTLTVGNTGTGSTSSTVTVTDTLPTGLTATGISGSGWSCTLGAALSCTRSDVLAAGSSYPAITLTVSVASNAAATLTNSVTASGGGATNSATSNDVTTITQLPLLSVSSTHTGNFTAGQIGGMYTLAVGNTGAGPTSSAVTVTDTLPTGLTATAMSGSGWSCTLGAAPSCTRNDVLTAGSSYPAITLTVNVASNAPATLTNSATASGGGATSNATSTDVTTITQLPVLSVSSTHAGNFTAGQTGALYTLTVGNTGAGPTSGTIMVTDTLPTGITATAISGSGWSCTLGTSPSCTRSDVLAAGSSYPAITLTVNVASSAAATVTNSVTASGGGATSNATASDSTTVGPKVPAATTTTLAIAPSSTVNAGAAVTLSATVLSGNNPVGQGLVNFCNASASSCTGAGLIASAQLNASGVATAHIVPGAGSYSISANFAGNSDAQASSSAPQSLVVSGGGGYATTTSISVDGNSSSYTLTGTVQAFGKPVPTGTVSFIDTSNGGTTVASASVDSTTLGYTVSTAPSSAAVTGLPVSLATADFNNDGSPDVAVPNGTTNSVSVFLGKGDGTFQTAANFATVPGTTAYAAAVGDFNADGNSDLVVTNTQGTPTVSVLLGNGDGTFQTQVSYAVGNHPSAAVVTDTNGDGNADLVVVNRDDNTVSILLGNGDGTFQQQTAYAVGNAPLSIAAADLNNGGAVDLVVANSADNTVGVLSGKGDGTFRAQVTYPTVNSPIAVALGDVNGDGFADLIVAHQSPDSVGVLLGNGDGTFQAETTYASSGTPAAVAVSDFDGDGHLDIAVTNSTGNTVTILRGNGDGTFQPAAAFSAGTQPYALVAADFNGDGMMDIAAVSNTPSGTVTALLSEHTETATANGVSLASGNHEVIASYPGDADHKASQSDPVSLAGAAPTATTTSLTASSSQIAVGATVTFVATVSPAPTGMPVGTVSFFNGSQLLGTGSLNGSGTATLDQANLAAGSYTVTAVYSGNAGFTSSTSSPVSVNVQSPSQYNVTAPQTPFTVKAGGSVSINISVPPLGGAYNSNVVMSATGLPAGATVSFSPASVVPGSAGATTTMTVHTVTQNAGSEPATQFPYSSAPIALGLCLVVFRRKHFKRSGITLLTLLVLGTAMVFTTTGCNGGFQGTLPQSQTYVITVTGTSNSLHASTTVTLIVK